MHKSLPVDPRTKYFLTTSCLFCIFRNSYSLCSSNCTNWLNQDCISIVFSSSSILKEMPIAFSYRCTGNRTSFPYTNEDGECPVVLFGVILLSHNAFKSFFGQSLWFVATIFLRIYTRYLLVDSTNSFSWG